MIHDTFKEIYSKISESNIQYYYNEKKNEHVLKNQKHLSTAIQNKYNISSTR